MQNQTSKIIFRSAESIELPEYLKTSISENKNYTQPSKFQKHYKPENTYGISQEAPSFFLSKYTILNKNTYNNPHLEPNQTSFKNFNTFQNFDVRNNQYGKIKLQNTNTGRTFSLYNCVFDKESKVNVSQEQYHTNEFQSQYKKVLENVNSPKFKKQQGLFGDFVDRNHAIYKEKKMESQQLKLSQLEKFQNYQESPVQKTSPSHQTIANFYLINKSYTPKPQTAQTTKTVNFRSNTFSLKKQIQQLSPKES